MRDNSYLEDRLYFLWENFFADVPRKNVVLIKFGKGSARQLGSIKWANQHSNIKGIMRKKKDDYDIADDKRISIITITKYFQKEEVPEYIIDATIAHELVHYTHGFHSPLERSVKHPHKGRVVEKELEKRGLGSMYEQSQKWLKENWRDIVGIRRRIIRRYSIFGV